MYYYSDDAVDVYPPSSQPSRDDIEQLKEDLNNLYRKLGYKTPDEERRERWKFEHGYDEETKTTKGLRAKAKDGFCYNIFSEIVYIGDN